MNMLVNVLQNSNHLVVVSTCEFPKEFHNVWQRGIKNNSYFLKLCGSGGGGYILGFTENFKEAKEQLKDHKLEVVYYF